ncbi:hypothetical protein SBRCBS47491_005106 [Sporothrix bragantina]|uniref:Peptidase M20 domain-containing protein 2 n=1 Tax=Sporothrix bragantina TaxID=671064 RepID=A0ABP0BVP4_9PEZI
MSNMDIKELQAISDAAINEANAVLREINLSLHSNPEIMYQEHHAHKILTDLLEERGFDVERGAFGISTAFRASYGSTSGGGRTASVNLEYDALRDIGHACGHNLIATAGLAAVLGVAAAIKRGEIKGRIVAFGTPAEEGGGGKIKMLRAGAFEGMACSLMVHPMSARSSHNNAYSSSMCGSELTIEYTGKPAHAMAAPWDGINALDAVTLLHTSVGLLRQQIMPTDRIRGVVLSTGQQSAVIPEKAVARYCVRSASLERYRVLKQKFVNCMDAAALATGCTVKATWLPAYWDIRTNDHLAARYMHHVQRADPDQQFRSVEEQKRCPDCYSTDQGNVTYAVPSIHPTFMIHSPDGAVHTREFTAAAATDDAHRRTVDQGKAMAAVALEVLVDDAFAAQVQAQYDAMDLSVAKDPFVQ